MTDEERRRLLVLAEDAERHAREAAGRGELLSRVGFLELALMARAALATPQERLTTGKYLRTLPTVMTDEHKAAISQGRAPRNPMLKAARARGFHTLKDLAKALTDGGYRVSASFLSQVVKGGKKMPPDLGRRIRDLTGWGP